jgi:pimeloyl-ACP methyl ester carboxylesterase
MIMRLLRVTSVIMVVLALGSQVRGQNCRPCGRPGGNCNINLNGQTFVLIADGESGLGDVATNLDAAYQDTRYTKPIIRLIPWTNSDLPVDDYRDRMEHLCGAGRMVQEVKRIHQCFPNSAIVLMGYSAGAHVVLLAAEQLPPGCVDRIILQSPAVSSCYDIRTALRVSRLPVEVFYNTDDTVLDSYQTQVGTADGYRMTTAGTTGFLLARSPLAKDPIFCGLRQVDVSLMGAPGGHYATIGQYFMQRNVLPVIPCGQVIPGIPQGPPHTAVLAPRFAAGLAAAHPLIR